MKRRVNPDGTWIGFGTDTGRIGKMPNAGLMGNLISGLIIGLLFFMFFIILLILLG